MNARTTIATQLPRAQTVLTCAARLAWQVVRLPILALLTLLEPVVRATISLAMALGILAATVFELSAGGPKFDFLEMLALSFGLGAALLAYYGLLAWISR